jgi:hypothetical protein
VPVGLQENMNQLVGSFKSNIVPPSNIWSCVPPTNRATHAPSMAQHFFALKDSFRLFHQHIVSPPQVKCIFSRGKRTANLPDEVRAQVLVLGGHCE